MHSSSIASLSANHTMARISCLAAFVPCSVSRSPNCFSTSDSMLRAETVLIAATHSPANPTLVSNTLAALSSKLFSILSWMTPAPKMNGKPPNITTKASFQPVARARVTVLMRETRTVISTARLLPVSELRLSGSVASRERRALAELVCLSKKDNRCDAIDLKYVKR